MDKYLIPLSERMRNASNPENAIGAKKYMKNQFEFLGINAPIRYEILREFFKENGLPEITGLKKIVFELWEEPEREYQYIAIELIRKRVKNLREEDIIWIEQLLERKSWWDTVDALSAWICGFYFQKYPAMTEVVTEKWILSKNIWLQRSALLFQLKYKKQTNTILLTRYIEHLIGSREFFINKAIGWILREYSKTNKNWVLKFVESHSLAPLSFREATKYL
jgi:3-methyladenine DNA glycosylase AlkD